jgi:membrane protein DedA with SNARE-associated domain
MHIVISLINDYGVLAVAMVVGLECIGFPVPGETALLTAAMYAGTNDDLNIVAVMITAAGAAIVGRMIGYLIGWEFHWPLMRYGHYAHITEGRIKLGRYLFLRHGGKVVLAAQFMPIIRTLAGVLAGVNMMPWRYFLISNVVGACAWSFSYGYGAYTLGHQFHRLQAPLIITLALILVIALIVGGIFVHRHERQLIAKAEAALPGPLDLPERDLGPWSITGLSRRLLGLFLRSATKS